MIRQLISRLIFILPFLLIISCSQHVARVSGTEVGNGNRPTSPPSDEKTPQNKPPAGSSQGRPDAMENLPPPQAGVALPSPTTIPSPTPTPILGQEKVFTVPLVVLQRFSEALKSTCTEMSSEQNNFPISLLNDACKHWCVDKKAETSPHGSGPFISGFANDCEKESAVCTCVPKN